MAHTYAPDVEQLITIKQAANFASCSDWTIRRLIDAGQLRAVRVGRAIRIYPDDLRLALRPISDQAPGGVHDDLEAFIEKVIAEAPPLTADQRNHLAALLAPAEAVVVDV